MARLGLRITDEMEDALNQEYEKSRVPISEFVRMAIEKALAEKGYTLTESVKHGGKRRPYTYENEPLEGVIHKSLPDMPDKD